MYINKALLYGNITRDPETKALPSGMTVVTFSIATNRTYKDKNGAKQEAVDYHNIVAFGKQAEVIAQYLRKGSALFIEGRIQTVVDNFQFGPKAPGAGASYGGGASQPAQRPAVAGKGKEKEPEMETIEYPDEDANLEDIPF
jgi:single-strand DNA-binding protein